MGSGHEHVEAHYHADDLGGRILAALEATGKDLDTLGVDDLAPVDAFHIRGRVATEELAEKAGITEDHLVLDVGSGLGGTSRYLAHKIGCEVVGIDLTEEYCRVAEMLSEMVDLADETSFRQGSALDLPFSDASFDVAWTEHVQMNIEDKKGFYREILRVLTPGGLFAFHDIFAGCADGFLYPVPWAPDASISHLVEVDALRALLEELGFSIEQWEEKTNESIAFFQGVVKRFREEGPPPISLHLLMGDNATEQFANLLQNLEAGRLCVLQGVLRKPEAK